MHNALTRRTREPSGGPPTLSISSDSASLAIEVLRFIVNLVPLWFSEAVYLDSSASTLTAAKCRILSRSKRKTGPLAKLMTSSFIKTSFLAFGYNACKV